MIRASCCCGTVRFTLTEAPTMMAQCHCARCRKVGASIFVFVKRDCLDWEAGRDAVATYMPEPPHQYARSFCSHCGTALGEIMSDAETFPIAADVLDDDPGIAIRFHEFVAEKPRWYEIGDSAKQFDHHPVKS